MISLQVEGVLEEREEDEKKDAEKDAGDDEAPKMFSIGQLETSDDEGGFAVGSRQQVRISTDLNQYPLKSRSCPFVKMSLFSVR